MSGESVTYAAACPCDVLPAHDAEWTGRRVATGNTGADSLRLSVDCPHTKETAP